MADDYDPNSVRFHGVNAVGEDASNDLMVEGNDIALLQDTAEVDAWGQWNVEWRDVFVLDANGETVGILNLTDHSLDDPANVDILTGLIVEASSP